MKKILLTCAILIQCSALANYNDIYIANVQYDWIDKSAMEKEAIINEVREIMFETPITKQEGFKEQFKDILKDKNHMEHYLAASAGHKEHNGYNISAFYYKNMKSIYMYGIQDKKDVSKAYYYDTLGHLKYVDFIQGEYPDYPYYTIQYKINGKPVSAIYNVSKDCQYLFTPEGEFEGVWYKHNLYNDKSKVILTRTTY